jgi:hypothetical protein
MSPSRPTITIRPRSTIADAALARSARTDLPGIPGSALGYAPRTILRFMRSLGQPLEPERVVVMPLTRAQASIASRRR